MRPRSPAIDRLQRVRLAPGRRPRHRAAPLRAARVQAGTWTPGLAYLSRGTGPPLVLLPGLTADHRIPHGVDRAIALLLLTALASGREVWWINRRMGLSRGTAMAAIADDYATVLRIHFAGPVDIAGVSTGGSAALQLAADHPDLVHRLVLVSCACRLGPRGRAGRRAITHSLSAGRRRRAGALLFDLLGAEGKSRCWAGAGWLLGPLLFRPGCDELLATMTAEEDFDLTDRLGEVQVPVLVVGGGRDRSCGPSLFAETASRLPRGRLLLYRRGGHASVLSRRGFGEDVLRFLDEPDHPDVHSSLLHTPWAVR